MAPASLTLALVLLPAFPAVAQRLRVTETAGVRRFGYPVTAPLPPLHIPALVQLQLLEGDKPVPAQFTANGIDFNVTLGPFEQREYTVKLVSDKRPPPSLQLLSRPDDRPHEVREDGDSLQVSYSGSLAFIAPKNLLGFLRAVKTPQWDYLRPGSRGLELRYKDDLLFRAGGFGPLGAPTGARVTKEGPLASTIEFSSTEGLRSSRSVASHVRMEFPRSKSWVKTTWTVEDPESFITGLGVDLNLNLASPPALVDFGGSSTVYSQLRPNESAVLIGGPQSWRVLVGPGESPQAYVTAKSGRAEGWAHVMDRERATAVAVEGFGALEDRIEVSAGGRLQIWREARGAGPKTLTFWLHFVTMPVQIGAATSPQAMLAPLKVEWLWTPNN